MWIDDTQPTSISLRNTMPDNVFLFSRLASITLADQLTTFFYHQINSTAFAEEQYDVSTETWLPFVYIDV